MPRSANRLIALAEAAGMVCLSFALLIVEAWAMVWLLDWIGLPLPWNR